MATDRLTEMGMAGKTVTSVAACVALGLIARGAVGQSEAGGSPPVVHGALGEKVDDYLTRLTAFGYAGAVIVAKDGQVILKKGYGYADRANKRPVKTDTVFTIGSITKQFTGAAIVKLEMEGKLNVDDPITKYFDNVPLDKSDITIHHLLTHTAGIEDVFGGDFDLNATREWVFQQIMKHELLWRPGTRHEYSNAGYSLLGMIVEKASGMPYEAYVREHLFKPAGMLQTGYVLPKYAPEKLAIGYQGGEPWGTVLGRPMLEDGPCWNLRANGGIHSTIGDMYRWHQALAGNEILSEAAKEKYFAPHADEGRGDSHYGYGWVNFKTRRGTRLLAHNGGNGIFSADFRRYVDEGVAYYHCSNSTEFFVDPISNQLSRIIFGEKYELPPKTIVLDASTLQPVQGKYELPAGETLTVNVEDGAIIVLPENQAGLSAVAPVRYRSASYLKRLNERAAELVRTSHAGDCGPLHRALGGELPLAKLVGIAREEWAEREGRLGPFRDVAVVGTVKYRGPMVATIVKLEFERGAEYSQYIWQGQQLAGVRGRKQPPAYRFAPVSPVRFVSYTLGSKSNPTVAFDAQQDGTISGMTIEHGGKSVIASRLP